MGELRRPYYTSTDPQTGKKVRRQQKTWQLRYYRNGRRYEESSRTTKKGEALALLRIREGAIAEGVPVTPKTGQLRFDQAAAGVVAFYKLKKRRTLSKVEGIIRNHLEPFFGGCRMADIATDDTTAYAVARQDAGAADATINRELACLKLAFTLAIKSKKLLYKPHIEMMVEDNARQVFFERDQFEALRRALPQELRGVVSMAYFSAWRIKSEILRLKWARVDREACIIRLEPGTTKNRKGRTLPYGQLPEFVDVIEHQWGEHQRMQRAGVICPHVFHRNGKPIVDFRGAWKKACTAAGLPGMVPHDFRRTAIRNLVRAGVSDTVAMSISGHKTRSVFDRYNISSETDKADALGRLGTAVAGQEKGRSQG